MSSCLWITCFNLCQYLAQHQLKTCFLILLTFLLPQTMLMCLHFQRQMTQNMLHQPAKRDRLRSRAGGKQKERYILSPSKAWPALYEAAGEACSRY